MLINREKQYSIKSLAPQIAGVLLVYGGLLHILDAFLLYYGISIQTTFMKYFTYDPHIFDNAVTSVEIVFGTVEIILGVYIFRKNIKAMILSILLIFMIFIKLVFVRSSYMAICTELLFLIMLLLSLKLYWRKNSNNIHGFKQFIAWLSIALSLLFGIFGSYSLRHHYTHMNTLIDAIYYTISTYSTVGYGDIAPATSNAKMFTSLMIIIGIGSFLTTISFVVAPMIENKLKGILNIMEKFTSIKDHVIICGFNNLSKILISNFDKTNVPYVVIDKSTDKIKELQEINANYIIGSPAMSSTLEKANVRHARAIICVHENDAENIISIMAVKEIIDNHKSNKYFRIITRMENEYNLDKYKNIGADSIISPSVLVAKSMLDGIV